MLKAGDHIKVLGCAALCVRCYYNDSCVIPQADRNDAIVIGFTGANIRVKYKTYGLSQIPNKKEFYTSNKLLKYKARLCE